MEPGEPGRVERRLAAILAADVAGYSRLIEADEEGTLSRFKALRAEVIDPKITGHHGRIVKSTGDGFLVEFASVVDALRCAAEVQAAMAKGNAPLPPDNRIEFRIGINVGDIVAEDGDIFGDGINVAARLEGLAEPGGICVSARVQEDASGRLDLAFEDIGEQALKNITRPVRVYRVREAAAKNPSAPAQPALPLPDKPSIAVLPFANISGDPEQLPGDAHAAARFAYRTFEDIANAQLAADLLHVDRLDLVGKTRIAGDDEQPVDTGERGDDLLDHPVGEILHYGPALLGGGLPPSARQ